MKAGHSRHGSEVIRYRRALFARYATTTGLHGGLAMPCLLARRLPYLRMIISRFFPQQRDSAVHDLGCGQGILMQCARAVGYRNVRGSDASPEQVAIAKANGIGGIECSGALEAVRKLKSSTQDLILAFDLVEHLTKDEVMELAREIHRVLKPRGSFLVHTPNGGSPLVGRTFTGDLSHETLFSQASLCQLLYISGFPRCDCHEDRPVVHGPLSGVRWILWMVLRSIFVIISAIESGHVDWHGVHSQNMLVVARKGLEGTGGGR